MIMQINLQFEPVYFNNEVTLFDFWDTILNEILKVYGKFGQKNYVWPQNIVIS